MVVRFRNQNFGAKMAKPLADYSDAMIKQIIAKYTERGATTGAAHPLVDFIREREKRKALGWGPRGLALNVVRISRQSKNGRAAYSDVWHCYEDGDLPSGQHWMKRITPRLDDLAMACVELKLPAITALITEKDKTIQSELGIKNLWDFAVKHGIAVGNSPEAYVRIQAVEAAQLTEADIEAAFSRISHFG